MARGKLQWITILWLSLLIDPWTVVFFCSVLEDCILWEEWGVKGLIYLIGNKQSDILLHVVVSRLADIPGCIFAGLLGMVVDTLLISSVALAKSPLMLLKGWKQLTMDLLGQQGSCVDAACVPLAGLAILLWPLVVCATAFTAMICSPFFGLFSAVIVYQVGDLSPISLLNSCNSCRWVTVINALWRTTAGLHAANFLKGDAIIDSLIKCWEAFGGIWAEVIWKFQDYLKVLFRDHEKCLYFREAPCLQYALLFLADIFS
jgi:hypothetical protein